ncbi:type I polyketide synthase [Lyngbya sp. CCAP 1446/10]|uniref:type I polyketide synthase n=1 Tax=Lyngbya sp. CCAP 1446/10 TaxID=439293 RepID=UPI002236FE57|nr:type I polyketide synthase [Lyngbya sp. CCAP 1446/10]MCW6050896.1 type I polyketide synthase [Lyngbya sp. CCAP 1446/10]
MDNWEEQSVLEPIAIIGMAGRFPGAKNVDEFWLNLCDGVESISSFSDEELRDTGVEDSWLNDSNYVKAGFVLDDIEMFDASFFGMLAKEAEITDPQHRLFLECAWEALENAGYDPEQYAGLAGVYAGANLSTYLLNNILSNRDLLRSMGYLPLGIGNNQDFLATRISYKLNLKGPSINVNTACSTSLVAVHSACRGLLSYECDMALAGGVSIQVPQKEGYFYQKSGIFSTDARTRAFDAKAEGTTFGNGVGIVVLKRLEDALADGDRIYALIKGSAINNDGSAKVSYTAPSVSGQAKVIAQAQAIARFAPETITYIETHGTGTSLGDPIEIRALQEVFGAQTKKKGFCAIGSVKTNVSHLNTAAGITGLIKTILALKHQKIPASLHFEKPNPEIDFANSPFYVNTTLREWKTEGIPRRAGVSSFGIGGTNAHVVLEEFPNLKVAGEKERKYQLLVLSAKTSSALETATANLATHLKQHPDLNLADVAYTLQVGRKVFDYRRMLVCKNIDNAVQALSLKTEQKGNKKILIPDILHSHYEESGNRSVVFMFSGQGVQYANMARELYQTESTFTRAIDDCCELLIPHLGIDLRTVLYPSEGGEEEAAQQLKQTYITQPVLFIIEYALAQLWMSWGVLPEAAIGHSIGEYVAATLAGVFSLQDALILVATRGKLMQQLPAGAMLAVPLSEQEIELSEELSMAVINAPSLCVVSGSIKAVDKLQNRLTDRGLDCRRLHTSHAFHSEMMEPIIEPFIAEVRKVKLKAPQIPLISNVTGTWITEMEATDPNYWGKHLRQTVRFADGIAELLKEPKRILLEVGPGRTLSSFAREHLEGNTQTFVLSSLRHPKDSQSDIAFFLNALGRLWLAGVLVNWSEFYRHERRDRIPLPTYPFERKRYWIEPSHPAVPDKKITQVDNTIEEENVGDREIEELMAQQMEIMSQQLDLLRMSG